MYLHGIAWPFFRDLWKPQTLGFAAERVRPFFIEGYSSLLFSLADGSDGGERIFAWHILPIDRETTLHGRQHLEMLKTDHTARVIIYCTSISRVV